MPVPRKAGCSACRKRHLGCDRSRPKCSACTRSRKVRECTYDDDLRIRPSYHAGQGSPEIDTRMRSGSGPVSGMSTGAPEFEGHPQELVEPGPADDHLTSDDLLRCEPSPSSGTGTGTGTGPLHRKLNLDWQSIPGEQPIPSPGPAEFAGPAGLLPHQKHNSIGSTHSISPELQSSFIVQHINPLLVSGDGAKSRLEERSVSFDLKVTDATESRVFDYYLRVCGTWLDVVSPARHFSRTVAHLATTEPAIYFACLTFASRLLYLHGKLEKIVAEEFHKKANRLLIQFLSEDRTPLNSDVLGATTGILRMWEQLYEISSDGQFHLNSAFSVFVRPGLSWSTSSNDMSGCALWLFVRQNIRASFLREQALQCDLSYVEDEGTYGPAPDEVWTNRITLLLARLCGACWGEPILAVRYELLLGLEARLEEWKRCLPSSFEPWSDVQVADDPFPIIRYICTWHTLAWHFYYAAKVLLADFHPKRPMNASTLIINRYINREIVAPAHLLCAICFADNDIGSGINGVHLMGWCGQFFTGSGEQRRLRDYMQTHMETNKWPNQACIARLERAWYGTADTP